MRHPLGFSDRAGALWFFDPRAERSEVAAMACQTVVDGCVHTSSRSGEAFESVGPLVSRVRRWKSSATATGEEPASIRRLSASANSPSPPTASSWCGCSARGLRCASLRTGFCTARRSYVRWPTCAGVAWTRAPWGYRSIWPCRWGAPAAPRCRAALAAGCCARRWVRRARAYGQPATPTSCATTGPRPQARGAGGRREALVLRGCPPAGARRLPCHSRSTRFSLP